MENITHEFEDLYKVLRSIQRLYVYGESRKRGNEFYFIGTIEYIESKLYSRSMNSFIIKLMECIN